MSQQVMKHYESWEVMKIGRKRCGRKIERKTKDRSNFTYKSIDDLYNFIADGKYETKENKSGKWRKAEWGYEKKEDLMTKEESRIMNDTVNTFKEDIERFSKMNKGLVKIQPIFTEEWLDEIQKLALY